MPHRVSTFFRAHSFDIPQELKRRSKTSSSSCNSRQSEKESASSSSSIIASDEDKMPSPATTKRLSRVGLHSPKASFTKLQQHHPASLKILMESPPLVFYGPATSSTGALLSGQLILNIDDETLPIEHFKMRLACEVTRKKPFHAHCHDCAHQSTDLTTWSFLQGPTVLKKGEHTFPFSFLLPGHLPASMKGTLSSIDYLLRATLTSQSGFEPIRTIQTLNIKRAVSPSETPRDSVRIFPPTAIVAHVQLPPVIHPIGSFNVSMRLSGTVQRSTETKIITSWRLKRVTWRLDETHKDIAPACPKHAAKVTNPVLSEAAKKGVAHDDVRTLGHADLKTGWKTDLASDDGTIEMEFPFGIRPDARVACDVRAEDGTEIAHVLVVEMVVAEEYAPLKKPAQAIPTGAARVLRMHFNLTVTERAGLGISWDEEQPPLYENVPASPPDYGNAELYEGEPIPDYEDLSPLEGVSGAPDVDDRPGPSRVTS